MSPLTLPLATTVVFIVAAVVTVLVTFYLERHNNKEEP